MMGGFISDKERNILRASLGKKLVNNNVFITTGSDEAKVLFYVIIKLIVSLEILILLMW